MSRKVKLVYQKVLGLLCLVLSAFYIAGFVGEGDITPLFLLVPLGLYLTFTRGIILR